jgi:outer membrane protein assembly factor BamE (lipoprotein component of BamABCDE complex)
MRLPIVLASLLALAPSCYISRNYVNEPLDAERVAQLVPGQTTADQALALLGAPTDVVQLGKRSAWRYEHDQVKTAVATVIVFTAQNTDAQSDRVWLFFDEHDVLQHFGATLSAAKAEWAMPWSKPHE